jgi:creatinine amidohydrolase
VLPLAAVEQHGPHLPLEVDVIIAEAYLARARKMIPVLMTSHGGNTAVMDIVARDLRARNAMLVVTCGWHRFGYPDGLFSAEEQRHGIHGGEIETSLMLAARPDAVQMEKADNFVPATVAMEKEFRWLRASRPAGFGWMTQDLHPSGAVGNAKAATAAKGEAALDHGATAFVELLREIDRFDLAALRKGPVE